MQNERRPKSRLTHIHVFGDESLHRGRFDLIGGIWIAEQHANALRSEITSLRRAYPWLPPRYEFKWKKAGGRSAPAPYLDLVDLVMQHVAAGRLAFHCLVIERSLVDNRAWNAGDEELGYYKAWALLLRKRLRFGCAYYVHLDRRTDQRQNRLPVLRAIVNACGRRDLGLTFDCCRVVDARDSKTDDLLQVSDVLLGAVGFHYAEDHLREGASPAKVEIAERICGHLERPSLAFSSTPNEERFNLWRWRPAPERERAP